MSVLAAKTCSDCKTEKPASEFHKNSRTRDGLQHRCKPCNIAMVGAWQKAHPAKDRAKGARYRSQHPDQKRGYCLKYKYGITLDQFDAMSKAQGGVCKICRRPEKLVVDHDHVTGKVRGLLCNDCNTTLGKFNDEAPRFLSAVQYLQPFEVDPSIVWDGK